MKTRVEMYERISTALANLNVEKDVANEIAFHLTDWKENFQELISLYEQGESLTDEQIKQKIIIFLAHVPNHLAAAKKLIGLGPIEDVFNVGVTEEDV